MSLPNMKKRYLQLNPTNSISSGDYSPSSGLPLIKFSISSTERPTMLDLSSLRINGKVTYFTGTVGTEAQVGGLLNNFRDGFAGDAVSDEVLHCANPILSFSQRQKNLQ